MSDKIRSGEKIYARVCVSVAVPVSGSPDSDADLARMIDESDDIRAVLTSMIMGVQWLREEREDARQWPVSATRYLVLPGEAVDDASAVQSLTEHGLGWFDIDLDGDGDGESNG
jgi:hypothetical protein